MAADKNGQLDRRAILIGGSSFALMAGGLTPSVTAAQSGSSEIPVTRFPSPYMNAKDTPLVTLEMGARVGRDTAAYWNLPATSEQRASYDKEIAFQVADGIWTFGSPSIVNSHAVQGPEGLIIYDTGENVEDGERFYRLLRERLTRRAAVGIQCTSPLFARQSYWCVIETLRAAGFARIPPRC